MTIDVKDLAVFGRYQNAPGHAFSKGLVTSEDKDAYDRIFTALTSAATDALSSGPLADRSETWNTRFYRDGGVQGQRPVDLWASIINSAPNSFGPFPQIYAIASADGLEVGFSVAIHEDDYYNVAVKARNREIIPALYRRLPSPDEPWVSSLATTLDKDGGWKFGLKTRGGDVGSFSSLAGLLQHLKVHGSERGGGAVYRLIPTAEIGGQFDILGEFVRAVDRFAGLMRLLVPSAAERAFIETTSIVRAYATEMSPSPSDAEALGKRWLLRQIAVRQGQAKFRDQLLDVYAGRCAVTGTSVLGTLQAAHIAPYNGTATNAVTNGILLRADIHNLFDLGLLLIDPDTFRIVLSEDVRASSFGKLHGRRLRLPKLVKHRPSSSALRERWLSCCGGGLVGPA